MDRFCHIFCDTFTLSECPDFAARAHRLARSGADGRRARVLRSGHRLNPFHRESPRLPRYARLSGKLDGNPYVMLFPSAWNGRLCVAACLRRDAFAAPDNENPRQGYAGKALVNGFAFIWGYASAEALLDLGKRLAAELYGQPVLRSYLRGEDFRLPTGFDGTVFPECAKDGEMRLRYLIRERGKTVSCVEPFTVGETELFDTVLMTKLLNWAEEGVRPDI